MTDSDLHRLKPFLNHDDGRHFLRATALVMNERGVAFIGQSGHGKSSTALELMALGAALISDDGVWLNDNNVLNRPENAPAMIEARGIGLLRAAPVNTSPLSLVVDLDQTEPERLPPRRRVMAPGGPVAFIRGQGHPFLAAALCQYLKMGRAE